MRGALKIDGIHDVKVEVGSADVAVTHDPKKIDVSKILAALQAAGEPAKAKAG